MRYNRCRYSGFCRHCKSKNHRFQLLKLTDCLLVQDSYCITEKLDLWVLHGVDLLLPRSKASFQGKCRNSISTLSSGGYDLPVRLFASRCLHLSDPAGLHLSGTPARRSSLPPQKEETAHSPWPIYSLFCSALPSSNSGGPESYFG